MQKKVGKNENLKKEWIPFLYFIYKKSLTIREIENNTSSKYGSQSKTMVNIILKDMKKKELINIDNGAVSLTSNAVTIIERCKQKCKFCNSEIKIYEKNCPYCGNSQ